MKHVSYQQRQLRCRTSGEDTLKYVSPNLSYKRFLFFLSQYTLTIRSIRLTLMCAVLAHSAWKSSTNWVFLRSSSLHCICDLCYCCSLHGIKKQTRLWHSLWYLLWHRGQEWYMLTFPHCIRSIVILKMLYFLSVSYKKSSFFFFKLLCVLQY